MKSIKLLLIAMIFLLLPSFSFAATYLKDIRVFGSSGIDDLIGPFDTFNIELVASIDGDTEITTNQVKFGSFGTPAQTCVSQSDGFKCTYAGSAGGLLAGEYSMPIFLYRDDNTIATIAHHTYIIDALGPSSQINYDGSFVGTSLFNFEVKASDEAFEGSSDCAGVKKITATLNDVLQSEKVFETKSCEVTAELNATPDSSDAQRLCVVAEDWLGNIGTSLCIDLETDNLAPEIIADSFGFKFSDNIFYFGLQQSYNGVFFFKVKEKNLDIANTFVDLSQINSQISDNIITPDSCEYVEDDIWLCLINSVDIYLETETPGISWDITDEAGNNALISLPFTFPFDKTGPDAIDLFINGNNVEPIYTGLTINAQATFTEAGSGMTAEKTFLNLFGANIIPATQCEKQNDSDIWSCQWLGISASTEEGESTIAIDPSTTDILGNPVTNTISKNVIIDITPPELINMTVEQQDQLFPLNDSFFECKPITMKATVSENNAQLSVKLIPTYLMATAPENTEVQSNDDQSSNEGCTGLTCTTGQAITGYDILAENDTGNQTGNETLPETIVECAQQSEGIFYCEYVIPCIPPGLHQGYFVFEDIAKNQLSVNYTFDVLDVLDFPTDYYIVAATERMPSAFDRSTAPYINHRILVLVDLEDKQTAAETDTLTSEQENIIAGDSHELIKVLDGVCSGEDMQYVKNYSVVDGSSLGEFPYIEIILNMMEMPRRSLQITCNLSLYSLIYSENMKYVNGIPETEEVEIEIPFYETQLPAEAVQAKIDEINNKWMIKNGEFITKMNQVLSYAETGCNIYSSLAIIDSGLSATCTGLTALGWVGNPACGAETVTSGFMDSEIGKVFAGICKFVNCDEPLWGKQLKKTYEDIWMGGKDKNTNAIYGRTDVEEWLNPKDSFFGSLLTGCLPGMIAKAEEARQITCSYSYCVQQMADRDMLTAITYCDQMYQFGKCKWITGEITYLIPPVKLVKEFGTILKQMFSDPVKLALGVSGGICQYIPNTNQPLHAGCMLVEGIPKILQGIQKLFSAETYDFTPPVDYCGVSVNE